MRVLQFAAVVLTAIAMVPGGAHFFELPNKIGLSEEQYFTVQAIYRGWAVFGVVIVAAIAVNLTVAWMLRSRRKHCSLALAAGFALAASLVIFFVWTYPANQATENWTIATANWEHLRIRWELAHTASAILDFIAFCCATLSAVLLED
jgi:hypothetical protein